MHGPLQYLFIFCKGYARFSNICWGFFQGQTTIHEQLQPLNSQIGNHWFKLFNWQHQNKSHLLFILANQTSYHLKKQTDREINRLQQQIADESMGLYFFFLFIKYFKLEIFVHPFNTSQCETFILKNSKWSINLLLSLYIKRALQIKALNK